MGDENSLAGRTQAHKHSAPSSDGGFLETTVTGVTNLSQGSIVYGDASEIVTELSAGSLNDVLTMGASVPAWSSGGGSSELCYDVVSLSEDGLGAGKDYYGIEITDGSSPVYGKSITTVSFWLRINGSPSGNGYAYIFNEAEVLQQTSDSPIAWNNLTGSWTKYTFTFATPHTVAIGDKFVIGGGTIGIGQEVSFYGDQSTSHTTFQMLVKHDTDYPSHASPHWADFGVSGAKWCFT